MRTSMKQIMILRSYILACCPSLYVVTRVDNIAHVLQIPRSDKFYDRSCQTSIGKGIPSLPYEETMKKYGRNRFFQDVMGETRKK